MRRPSTAVRAVMDRYYSSLPVASTEAHAFHAKLLGVHVRMNTDVHGEIGDSRDNMLDLAVPFRLSCHWRHFADRIAALQQPVSDVFVASDTGEAVSGLSQHVDVHTLPLCLSRNITCMQIATASAMLLSKCSHVLLSRWSAFSEVAARAGAHKFTYACDEPGGGWRLASGRSADLKEQVRAYLDAQGWQGKPRVLRAYDAYQQ